MWGCRKSLYKREFSCRQWTVMAEVWRNVKNALVSVNALLEKIKNWNDGGNRELKERRRWKSYDTHKYWNDELSIKPSFQLTLIFFNVIYEFPVQLQPDATHHRYSKNTWTSWNLKSDTVEWGGHNSFVTLCSNLLLFYKQPRVEKRKLEIGWPRFMSQAIFHRNQWNISQSLGCDYFYLRQLPDFS